MYNRQSEDKKIVNKINSTSIDVHKLNISFDWQKCKVKLKI